MEEKKLIIGGLPSGLPYSEVNTSEEIFDIDVPDELKSAIPDEPNDTLMYSVPVINECGNIVKSPSQQQSEYNIVCNSNNIPNEVCAIFTTPRLCFADNLFCAQNALYGLGIQCNWSQGVFWGQVMTRLLVETTKRGFKYALVLDYDSVFTLEDIRELYAIMESQPDVSAVIPLQLRRGDGSPLATILDTEGNEALIVNRKVLELTTVQVSTGHFGLSLIRLADLKKLEKPWFLSKPNCDGDWDSGKIDEDIMFWTRMREAGNKVVMAPNIHIGHMELMVLWADNRLNPIHQPINEYQTGGKPDYTFGKRMVRVQAEDVTAMEGVGPNFTERV